MGLPGGRPHGGSLLEGNLGLARRPGIPDFFSNSAKLQVQQLLIFVLLTCIYVARPGGDFVK